MEAFATFLLVKNGDMQIETVTDILSSARESLADSKSSASLQSSDGISEGLKKARFTTRLALMYIVSAEITVGGVTLSRVFHSSALLLTTLFTVNVL